jgi:nucleoside-diphosphate-sugar epimerase
MKVFLTGGSGDLGLLLSRELEMRGDLPVRMDIRAPKNPQRGEVIEGSILDRDLLAQSLTGADCIVHIAAWHGVHDFTGQKNVYDFWDLNVTGTFNVFQAAVDMGISHVVFISSTSVEDRTGVYGHTKILNEEMVHAYRERHGLPIITLRPGAFIPPWNTSVYKTYLEWVQWFWKGAVHISDVMQGVLQAVDLLIRDEPLPDIPLTLDGQYDYKPADMQNWDAEGVGSTFMKYYARYAEMVQGFGLDISQKPHTFDISQTHRWLGYDPQYGMSDLLQEMEKYGADGPPPPEF